MNAECTQRCCMQSRRSKRREKQNRDFHLTSSDFSNLESRKMSNARILNRWLWTSLCSLDHSSEKAIEYRQRQNSDSSRDQKSDAVRDWELSRRQSFSTKSTRLFAQFWLSAFWCDSWMHTYSLSKSSTAINHAFCSCRADQN